MSADAADGRRFRIRRARLDRPASRPRDAQGALEDEIRDKSGGARASDEQNFHEPGTGAIETNDGLDEMSEMVRHLAEDLPDQGDGISKGEEGNTDDDGYSERANGDDVAVFDRGRMI
jgi:hypothetical protein